jgi:hypothetical protein
MPSWRTEQFQIVAWIVVVGNISSAPTSAFDWYRSRISLAKKTRQPDGEAGWRASESTERPRGEDGRKSRSDIPFSEFDIMDNGISRKGEPEKIAPHRRAGVTAAEPQLPRSQHDQRQRKFVVSKT